MATRMVISIQQLYYELQTFVHGYTFRRIENSPNYTYVAHIFTCHLILCKSQPMLFHIFSEGINTEKRTLLLRMNLMIEKSMLKFQFVM